VHWQQTRDIIIIIVAVQSNRLDYTPFSMPEIKSPQDLKGGVIGSWGGGV
jgi:hypothetical protein